MNSDHPNIDNHAELYVIGTSAQFISSRLEYSNSFILFSIEPYMLLQNSTTNDSDVGGTYKLTNNHTSILNSTMKGFRQSMIILHYKGIGFGYGNMSHWWGPGFHSALSLSSNAPSQKTYSFGTFKDISIGKFAFGSKIIAMPYENSIGQQIYFTGLKTYISYNSKDINTKIGFHRTYLSGDFSNLSTVTNSVKNWSLLDAAGLVFEPLFGQSKKDLPYAEPGTPGFDPWDEILTGFIELLFPNQNLKIYADIASDDNRGNLLDLRAHWDHTLGYQLGINKFTQFNNYNLFTGVEFLTTRISNTFNPYFYRGDPNKDNYYTKDSYDYFSYQNRRMGAHSGSSSDDLIFMIGLGNEKNTGFFSYNKERHGIKSMVYPEFKTELTLTYYHKVTKNYTAFISLEYEKINNFSFIKDNISISRLIWLGFSLSID